MLVTARMPLLCGLIFAFFPPLSLASQASYLPPNPITPPGPPVIAPVTGLTPPAVTAPTAISPAPKADAAASATAKTAAAGSSLPPSLNELTNPSALLNALNGTGTDAEGLDALTNLLGGGTSGTTGSDSATAAALEKILALLEKQQTEASAKTAAAPLPVKPEKISSGGSLVRFGVNNFDIASTTTSLISSVLARDGSFLLTGERSYLSSNRTRNETFYLLCKKSGADAYRLYADVSQDAPNAYSFLYQLARKTPLNGTLTGDLLVFRTADPAWNLDLVIRVITPSVSSSTVR